MSDWQDAIDRFGQLAQSVFPAGTSRAINTIAVEYTNELKDTLHHGPPRSGRVYRRGDDIHVASAPGEPPKSDSGGLASSIQVLEFASPQEPIAKVGAMKEYAERLEIGDGRVEPRPLWGPAADKLRNVLREKIISILGPEVERWL